MIQFFLFKTLFIQVSKYTTVLQNPLILKLVTADSISALGSRLTYFVLLKKVYEISAGNVVDIGFLGTAQIFPFMLLGPFAGVLADRVSRRRVMVMTDICNGIAIIALIFINNLFAIYAVSFIISCFFTFRSPAQNAFEPNLVARPDISLLNSFKSFISSFVNIAGYSLGATVVAFSGVTVSFVIDAATFFISATIIAGIRQTERHIKKNVGAASLTKNTFLRQIFHQFKADVKAGVDLVRENVSLRLLLVLEMSLSFIFGMQGVLFYVFIRETLQLGGKAELAWGGIMSCLSIGSIIGSVVFGLLTKHHTNRIKLFLKILLFDGIVLAIFSLNTVFIFSILLSFLLGIIGAAPLIILNTILQESVADENRGKVFSFFSILGKPMTMLSVFFGTATAKLITAQGTLLVLALMEMAIVLVIFSSQTYQILSREAEQSPNPA
jgi:MFS transporter, DHA3 family, macrolide efflux protein